MEYTREDLDKHIKEEHKLSPFAEYLKEIVYGGSDGIVTTFAVVAGFTGANSANPENVAFVSVLLFGLANLFADASSMGLGNFLSIRSDQLVYRRARKKEAREVVENKAEEIAETELLLTEKGFSKEDAKKMTELYARNEEFWIDFMMEHELEMPSPENENPIAKGFVTFLAFMVFGFIPLIPYLVIEEIQPAFSGSIIATLIALILLGLLRFVATKEKPLRAVAEMVLIGGVSAVIAYIVGSFFG